jgi:hypothetical protein
MCKWNVCTDFVGTFVTAEHPWKSLISVSWGFAKDHRVRADKHNEIFVHAVQRNRNPRSRP